VTAGATTDLRPDHFEYVRAMVRDRAGIVLEDGKEYLVATRLSALARARGGTVEEIIETGRRDPRAPANDEIVDAMTTNETSFFRDIHPFTTLQTTILPQLIQGRSPVRRLRILSAASSTGQEAYSIAMLLRTHFPQLGGWDVRIVGTDISTEALAKARSGRYSQLEVNRGLPATMLRWFHQDGREFVVDDTVRSLVEFRSLNLVAPWPLLEKFDLVLLRNVLIYFDTPTKQAILGRVRGVLAPDGLLLLGTSETTLNLDDAYRTVRLGTTTVYALDDPRSAPWCSPPLTSAS
jgi:chemotaxis protein methyltransferase CheR